MKNIYEECPVFENEQFLLRPVKNSDCAGLLKVYSDEKAIPFFNSDNCHGDDFHYTTMERMTQAIDYWDFEYKRNGFVRWTIMEKGSQEVLGTIELFNRKSDDTFNHCGILRLDLRSDYEKTAGIQSILQLILQPAYLLFECEKIATKAIPLAKERISALQALGFMATDKKLIGHDGTAYENYYICYR